VPNSPDNSFTISVADEPDVEGIIDLLSSVAAEERWIGTELPIDRDARRKSLLATMTRSDALVLVARVGVSIVAEATLWPQWPGLLHLGMAVELGWRGRGVGTALLARAIAWARDEKAHKICLEVFPHNTAAIALYEKYGFVREGLFRTHVRRLSGELWDSIPMGLRIRS
jgi:ribosomal-protein-alanine N-acetyltransferase